MAIRLSAFAYAGSRKHAKDSRFAFGTRKIEVLGGFASAIFLQLVVALMVYGSVERLFRPEPIHYQEAMLIGVLGLAVNWSRRACWAWHTTMTTGTAMTTTAMGMSTATITTST